jgi:anti-sigma factor RsiW
MNVLAFSHRRAERLIDERLDGRLEAHDLEWLDEHLRGCAECRTFEERRRKLLAVTRALKTTSAPEGFAARVMAAKNRGAQPAPHEEELQSSWGRFAVAGAIAAAAVIAFVSIGTMSPTAIEAPGGVGVSGTGALEQAELHPHFVVRAPGLGPAKARAQAVAIVEAHGGSYSLSGGALYARVPREHLVAVVRDLSKQSQYKVARSDAGELDSTLTEVVIKFELE